jgi:hypothetical protein
MATAKDIMDHFISRAKHLQEFDVTTEVPADFRFNGVVPFDIVIKEGVMYAKVWAIDFDEAAKRLDDFLEVCK